MPGPERKVIPRWRTMIEPAVTSWPSPALTPSRWPTLSRPFLTLPPAFLWAISSTRPSSWRGCASERPAWRRCVGLGRLAFVAWRRRRCRRLPPLVLAAAFVAAAGFGFGLRRRLGGGLALAGASALALAAVFASAFLRRLRAAAPAGQLGGELGVLGGLGRCGLLEPLALGLRLVLGLRGASFAALLPSSVMSLMRRTVSSWRWPFLTRLRAFGPVLERDQLLAADLADDLGADRRVRDQRSADRRRRRRRRRAGRDRG